MFQDVCLPHWFGFSGCIDLTFGADFGFACSPFASVYSSSQYKFRDGINKRNKIVNSLIAVYVAFCINFAGQIHSIFSHLNNTPIKRVNNFLYQLRLSVQYHCGANFLPKASRAFATSLYAATETLISAVMTLPLLQVFQSQVLQTCSIVRYGPAPLRPMYSDIEKLRTCPTLGTL